MLYCFHSDTAAAAASAAAAGSARAQIFGTANWEAEHYKAHSERIGHNYYCPGTLGAALTAAGCVATVMSRPSYLLHAAPPPTPPSNISRRLLLTSVSHLS